jgi:hypothetical protein
MTKRNTFPQQSQKSYEEDVSPSTSCYDRSSVETFDSTLTSDDGMQELELDSYDDYSEIPPLPVYRREVVDPTVRPSNPEDFARFFPSMDRLSIRHDEFTPDGNMNLRVDTVTPGRRRVALQLFHLRMYDLAKREFSLRRYCRESGREVCNSKRKYAEQAADGRPNFQRSVSSVIKKSLGTHQFRRTNSGHSLHGGKRPESSHSWDGADGFNDNASNSLCADRKSKSKPVPTNTIKLEFSNYARVDVSRRGGKNSKHYDFEWWGHKYSWKRVTDKNLNVVSFHLMRDGSSHPVAHIVPETRSPTQVMVDERAGGWVPPCYMWISDRSIIDAMTDCADVVIATGLMALVDDCIKERWQVKKPHRIPLPLTSKTIEVEHNAPMAFVQNMIPKRYSSYHGSPISAY